MLWSVVLSVLLSVGSCEVYFSEIFSSEDSLKNWVESAHHGEETKGSWSIVKAPDDGPGGLRTDADARFYAISSKIEKPFSNKGKTLVVQYTVKYNKTVSCGGAYLKLLRSDVDQSKFHGETPYLLMFGPDICGYSTKKVHAIFNYKDKNHLIKKDIRCKDDTLPHLYTFILKPTNEYSVLIDNVLVDGGRLEDDWDMLPPKKIDDPEATKPADWVDEPDMIDPDDKKPDDWDQPKTIPDPEAKKNDDWDDEMDGEWEPPQIPNPAHKGDWEPKKIPNPAYKGPYAPPQIDNPDYKPNDELYILDDIGHVGFDLWQVTSGSIFDNILLTDDPDFAKSEGERLWRPYFDTETKKEKMKEKAAAAEEQAKSESVDDSKEPEDGEESVEDVDKSEEREEEKPEEPKAESREEL